jgi:hypothetical protein
MQFVTVTGVRGPMNVVLRMSAGSSVAGCVTFDSDAPPNAEGFEIAAVPGDADFVSLADNPFARADIHGDWTFEMHGLNGPRRLALLGAPDGWTVERISVNGADVTDEPIAFGADSAATANAEVALTSRGTAITGMVSDEAGAPAPDVTVLAFAADRNRWYSISRFVSSARTSVDGGFTVSGLPAGSYYLVAVDAREIVDVTEQLSNPEFLATLTSAATQVTLERAQHSRINLRLSSR